MKQYGQYGTTKHTYYKKPKKSTCADCTNEQQDKMEQADNVVEQNESVKNQG